MSDEPEPDGLSDGLWRASIAIHPGCVGALAVPPLLWVCAWMLLVALGSC